jgi:hypothetical protein
MLATLGGYAYMLTLAFTPSALGVDNTLGGFASHWLFIRPGIGNTLGGCASNSGIGNTLGGCASHCLLHHRRCSVYCINFGSTYSGSTTISPTTSIRQRHRLQQEFDNHHATPPTTTYKSFVWCPHMRHTRLRRQGESRIRVPAIVSVYPRHSGATDEGMTPRSSIFAYLIPAKEEALSKDIHEAREGPNTPIWSRRQEIL